MMSRGVRDDVDDLRVLRGGGGIDEAPQPRHEIRGDDRDRRSTSALRGAD